MTRRDVKSVGPCVWTAFRGLGFVMTGWTPAESTAAPELPWLLVAPGVCGECSGSCPLRSDGSRGRSEGREAGDGCGRLCASAGDHAPAKAALPTGPHPRRRGDTGGHGCHPTWFLVRGDREGQGALVTRCVVLCARGRGGHGSAVTAPCFQATLSRNLFINPLQPPQQTSFRPLAARGTLTDTIGKGQVGLCL